MVDTDCNGARFLCDDCISALIVWDAKFDCVNMNVRATEKKRIREGQQPEEACPWFKGKEDARGRG